MVTNERSTTISTPSDISTEAGTPTRELKQRKKVPEFVVASAIAGAADEEPDVAVENIKSQDSKMRMIPNEKLTSFLWTSSPQPHAVRRRCILEKHPEVEELYGNDATYVKPPIV